MNLIVLEESCIKNNMKLNSVKKNRRIIKKGKDKNMKCRSPNGKPKKERNFKKKKKKEWKFNFVEICLKDLPSRTNYSSWLSKREEWSSKSTRKKWKYCGFKDWMHIEQKSRESSNNTLKLSKMLSGNRNKF